MSDTEGGFPSQYPNAASRRPAAAQQHPMNPPPAPQAGYFHTRRITP